jgi:hypothetical protein
MKGAAKAAPLCPFPIDFNTRKGLFFRPRTLLSNSNGFSSYFCRGYLVKKATFARAAFSALLVLAACNKPGVNSNDHPPGATSVSGLEILPSDSTGWVQDTNADTFTVSGEANFHGVLDGGDVEYISRGLVEVSVQNLAGPDSQTMKAFCMDFGTAAKAYAMFEYKKSSVASPLTIPPFATNTAAGNPVPLLQGITVYSCFGKFYLELQMVGFKDQALAVSAASLFLTLYSLKIN